MRHSPLRPAVLFILLLALTTLTASAQTAKDKTKDKAGDKNKPAPAKAEEPKAIVALRGGGQSRRGHLRIDELATRPRARP